MRLNNVSMTIPEYVGERANVSKINDIIKWCVNIYDHKLTWTLMCQMHPVSHTKLQKYMPLLLNIVTKLQPTQIANENL